ncbi:MAG: Mrp/NBP35 family ATP-binding protein [Mariniphaga sp.]|nr:Mrp/NBP35 family ATP-binding protein [Mariniphaga sp.]
MDQKHPILKTKLPNIKNIIIVASGKGGVGKSTVAVGLALSLTLEGFSTGLLDADIYGPSIPTLFNLKNERPKFVEDGKNKIEPLIKFGIKVMSIGFFIDPKQAMLWRGPLASNGLKQLINDTDWGELDYLIIDTPPGTGDIHLTLTQEFEINGAVIVTTPQVIALDDVQKAIGMFQNQHVGIPVLGIVENMAWFTPSKHPEEKYFLFGKGGGEYLSKTFNIPLIAQIPMNETICASCDEGKLNGLLKDSEVKSAFDNLLNGILNSKEEFVK